MSREKETIWRVQEDDFKAVITNHFPELAEDEKATSMIIDEAKKHFYIDGWDQVVMDFIQSYLE